MYRLYLSVLIDKDQAGVQTEIATVGGAFNNAEVDHHAELFCQQADRGQVTASDLYGFFNVP